MTYRGGFRLLRIITVVASVNVVHGQSTSSLQPPNQTYFYDFSGYAGAPVPAIPALSLGASFSIEFWIMLDPDAVDSQYMRAFSKANAYELDLVPGTHQLSYSQGGSAAQTGMPIATGQWYHVAIVSNNLQVTLFLNGQPQGAFTATSPPSANALPLVLSGQTYGDGTQFCCGFPGGLRQFRIWGRALQPAEISSVATTLLSGTEAGLIADWPLDEGQGQTLHDLGPNQLTLLPRSGVWERTAIVAGGPYFQGKSSTISEDASNWNFLIPIDFDSDGNVDLLVCGNAHTTDKTPCGAFRNDGNGNFTDVTLQVLGPAPPGFEAPGDYCVADFNGDGRADVFIANHVDCCGYPPAQQGLLLQTADGRLQDVSGVNLPPELAYADHVACGDIDGDGSVDIFLPKWGGYEIYLNDGHGHFTVADPGRLPAAIQPTLPLTSPSAKFIDVNRDGRLDLFASTGGSWDSRAQDWLALNDGRGYFAAAPDNTIPTRYGGRLWQGESTVVADINGDGWPDLVNTVSAPNWAEGAIQILLNNQDGTFRDATDAILQPAWPRYGSVNSIVYLSQVSAGDFNGDGFVDLLVQGVNQPSHLFMNTGPSGGGRLVDMTGLLPSAAGYLAVADFNGDGLPDIAVLSGNSPAMLETWVSSRKFTFTPDLIPPAPTGPFFLRGSVLNSASFSATALAPGEFVTIYGSNFGPDELQVASPVQGSFPTQLAGVRALFNDLAAPIVYTAAGVVTAIVPFGMTPNTRADVVIEYQGTPSPPVSIFVDASAPGLFTSDGGGIGPGALLNVDPVTGATSLNGSQNPAPPGGIVTAYITGAGQTSPPSHDGAVATTAGGQVLTVDAGLEFFSDGQSCSADPICVPVQILYAGPAPGLVAGVTQINLRLPDTVSSGAHTLGMSVAGIWSQYNVTVSIANTVF